MTLRINGSTSGYTEITAPAVAGNNTLLLPASGAGSLIASSDTGTVSTAMLATDAVTADKLSNGVAGTGVGYVRDGGAAVASSQSYGHITYEAPNGVRVLMQWGQTGNTSITALTGVSFHVPFKTSRFPSVTVTAVGVVFGFTRTVSVGNLSTTGFDCQVRDNANTAVSSNCRWIAVGEAP